MKKIIFLHGFYASGQSTPALALQEALEGKVEVLTPDLPLYPLEALEFIHTLCDKEHPDLLVGNSNGAFLAQIIAPIVGVPALLGNPHFEMTKFLSSRIGPQQYKSQRRNGCQNFEITQTLIDEFVELQTHQFDYASPYYKDKIWGIFGEQDTLAGYESIFLQHYNELFHFPGSHTPTANEVKTWYVPLVEKMLMTFEKPSTRFFRHFKGGNYRLMFSALDSETQERMVVYQALYGEQKYWVRPEKMFFEKVNKDGRTFPRFIELDKEQ